MPDLDNGRRLSRLWILAGLGALTLHLGGAALAFANLRVVDDDPLGAPAIEVGVDMTSPRREQADLPPGPDSDASVASPALAEQKAEPKDTDLPKDKPDEADDPDRVVTPNDAKKPVEDETKVAAVQTSASRQSVAAEATATPDMEAAREGSHSVAPALGTGDSARRMKLTWQKALIAHFDKYKRYPADRALKRAAEILVNFALDRRGHVLSATVVKSSGDPAFDQAALAMVKRSDPVPQPPPLVADEGLNFTVPVIFRARGKS